MKVSEITEPHTFYHGTMQEFEKEIKGSEGLLFGDGQFGYVGVFLSKSPEGAMFWSRWSHRNFFGEHAEHHPLILKVTMPEAEGKFITPDFNQAEDVFYTDPATEKEVEIYTPDRDWRLPWVEDVIYNKCKRNDDVWEDWYKEHGQKVAYEVDLGQQKSSAGCRFQAPLTWVQKCIDLKCKETHPI